MDEKSRKAILVDISKLMQLTGKDLGVQFKGIYLYSQMKYPDIG
jgi:hypothetical protein